MPNSSGLGQGQRNPPLYEEIMQKKKAHPCNCQESHLNVLCFWSIGKFTRRTVIFSWPFNLPPQATHTHPISYSPHLSAWGSVVLGRVTRWLYRRWFRLEVSGKFFARPQGPPWLEGRNFQTTKAKGTPITPITVSIKRATTSTMTSSFSHISFLFSFSSSLSSSSSSSSPPHHLMLSRVTTTVASQATTALWALPQSPNGRPCLSQGP